MSTDRVDSGQALWVDRARSTPQLSAIAFVIAAGLPVWLALDEGGYDLVVRQEAGLAIWWGLGLAFAFGLLPRVRPAARMPLAAVALLLAWTAASLLWTASDERTLAEFARTLAFGGVLVLVWYGAGPRSWVPAAAGLSVALCGVPILAVLSRLAPDLALPGSGSLTFDLQRLSYPLGYWNAVGAWSAMAVGAGIAWSVHLDGPRLRRLALAVVPVCGLAIYLTYSRGAVIGAAIGVLVVLALSEQRVTAVLHAAAAAVLTAAVILVAHGQDAIARGTGGTGGGLVAVVLLAACLGCWLVAAGTSRPAIRSVHAPPWLRAGAVVGTIAVAVVGIALGPRIAADAGDQLSAGYSSSATDDPAAHLVSLGGSRPALWSAALDAFASDPLEGIGPGTYEYWWARHGDGDEYVRDAHSLYLESLAELGVPGLLLVVGLLGGLLAAALRARARLDGPAAAGASAALVAAFAVFLFTAGVDWMWESTAVAVVALAAVALAAAPLSQPRSRRRQLTGPRIALTALAVAAGATQIPGVVATERVRASQFRLSLGDRGEAIDAADDAVRAEPWAATPYDQRALVELARGNYAHARQDARAAIEREPTNWRHRFLLLRVQVARGDEPAALAAMRQARRLYPAIGIDAHAVHAAVSRGAQLAGGAGPTG